MGLNRVLIANRGEIAVRIIKTLRKMGIESVAIYSDTDKSALHVKNADFAYPLEGATSAETYLNQEKIIAICKKANVDGVHPGYGFMSENGDFVDRLEKEGIVFIGPSAKSMHLMGNKITAKKTVANFDVPLIPGVDYAISSVDEAVTIANDIGYPVLIKAASGGGGKGMRVARSEEDLQNAFERSQSEALKAFGDDSCFVEKYVEEPKHIEVQVMADKHGNVHHVFERDCSVQRRHQKVIEEAPSAIFTQEQREKIGAVAVNVAKSCDYVGAGTVEFIYDKNGDFFFLEMNTRLQVEHPVTEMVAGLDLVEWQIRIANGEKMLESDIPNEPKGHSIEVRVYAEDSFNDFAPNVGLLNAYKEPSIENVRIDSGIEEGNEISLYFDPMISKLIVHAPNRNEAIELMKKAINNYNIEGLETTLDFCDFTLNHQSFIGGKFSTNFVNEFYSKDIITEYFEEKNKIKVALASAIFNNPAVKVKRSLSV
jgi:pyruvate carboxylase subunit A